MAEKYFDIQNYLGVTYERVTDRRTDRQTDRRYSYSICRNFTTLHGQKQRKIGSKWVAAR